MQEIIKDSDHRMKQAVEVCRQELSKIRTGRATTALLDGVRVEYYGSMVPLHQVANVSTPDAHLLSVQPWEKAMTGVIEKAILGAGLGLNPVNDGSTLRVPIPPPNEERRRDLVKLTKKFGEDAKIAIRNVRRDAIEHAKKKEKDQHVSEDELKRAEDEIQKTTDRHIKEVDQLLSQKEKEIMEV